MTKQEEIRELLEMILQIAPVPMGDVKNVANTVLDMMQAKGVVMTGDKESTDFIKCPCDDCTAEPKLIDEWGYFCDLTCGKRSQWKNRLRGQNDVIGAGYVAVEPLIKDSK